MSFLGRSVNAFFRPSMKDMSLRQKLTYGLVIPFCVSLVLSLVVLLLGGYGQQRTPETRRVCVPVVDVDRYSKHVECYDVPVGERAP